MRAMVASWQQIIYAIGTGPAGGLERSRERWLSRPAFRRRGARADKQVAGGEGMNVRGIVCHCCFFALGAAPK
jgi:hypothetical protein